MKIATTLLVVTSLVACATPSPHKIELPPSTDPSMAQITVKREFRVLGGGSSQIYDLFDYGTGVDFNADVPSLDETAKKQNYYIFRRNVSTDLFETMRFYQVFGSVPAGYQMLGSVNPLQDKLRVVNRIEESLLGATLVYKIDLTRGGARVNPANSYYGDFLQQDPRGDLQRVKLRQLYDARNKILYRTIHRADDYCLDADLAGIRSQEIEAVYVNEGTGIKDRALDFLYGEYCGLVTPFELHWNAQHVGPFPGFSELTWKRRPGRMQLYAYTNLYGTPANAIDVEAGKQYVGIFDPNNRYFKVEEVK